LGFFAGFWGFGTPPGSGTCSAGVVLHQPLAAGPCPRPGEPVPSRDGVEPQKGASGGLPRLLPKEPPPQALAEARGDWVKLTSRTTRGEIKTITRTKNTPKPCRQTF